MTGNLPVPLAVPVTPIPEHPRGYLFRLFQYRNTYRNTHKSRPHGALFRLFRLFRSISEVWQ